MSGQIESLTAKEQKAALRKELKQKRAAMSAQTKQKADECIRRALEEFGPYRNADVLLAYVSSEQEVDTLMIITSALANGKTVLCPRCIKGEKRMVFCCIASLGELSQGSYGIYEPNADCRVYGMDEINDAQNVLCLVPGLSFDRMGMRLGYGGGYYDRFLSDFRGTTVGLGYHGLCAEKLPCEQFDLSVKYVLTESGRYV